MTENIAGCCLDYVLLLGTHEMVGELGGGIMQDNQWKTGVGLRTAVCISDQRFL
jgi:hypothetical protein